MSKRSRKTDRRSEKITHEVTQATHETVADRKTAKLFKKMDKFVEKTTTISLVPN